ncbi:LysR family transcriptional regulator [Nevskia soli]|uniref:LysR family transcriptional regulator n=1 Tax=Nevskia soli TaxID=418856 RepID=UPI00068AE31A|nr:LysR family transcriptional regulator [Nevskia soli]
MDRYRAIETFSKAADLGSFHQAAIAQGTTPQAVSKAVRQLEQALGLRLFHRTTRKSTLTEDGRRFLDNVRPGLETIAGAWSGARDAAADEEGLIRITATRSVGKEVLVPLIVDFRKLLPRVGFELLLDELYTDIVAQKIDVGFRSGQPPDRQLVVRELFRMQLIICASPDYLRAHGAPASIQELARHACTGFRQPNTGRMDQWELRMGTALSFIDLPAAVCSNDSESEIRAVEAGLGVGQLDSIGAAPGLRAGRLVPLLFEHISERHSLHLYYAQRSDMPRRVRHFIDFSVKRLRGTEQFRFSRAALETMRRAATARPARAGRGAAAKGR